MIMATMVFIRKKTATIKGIYAVVAALVRTYNRG